MFDRWDAALCQPASASAGTRRASKRDEEATCALWNHWQRCGGRPGEAATRTARSPAVSRRVREPKAGGNRLRARPATTAVKRARLVEGDQQPPARTHTRKPAARARAGRRHHAEHQVRRRGRRRSGRQDVFAHQLHDERLPASTSRRSSTTIVPMSWSTGGPLIWGCGTRRARRTVRKG